MLVKTNSWRPLPQQKRELFWQLLRYLFAGASVLIIQVIIYNVLADFVRIGPQFANASASGIVLVIAYNIHSRFTFRGHGNRDSITRNGFRFVIAHGIGWLLNTGWVWLLVARMGLPRWTPSIPMVAATPLVLFLLKRYWVFA
jgi:putative flippase GtrA